ncbi:MAG: hypothetical protein Kow0019_12390 [Methanobacteriaceae archaeon]
MTEETKKEKESWWKKTSQKEKIAIGTAGFCCLGIILIVGIAGFLSPDSGENSSDYTSNSFTTTEPEPPVETESQYKASCKAISFKELNKNPDAHAGERVKLSGRVIQIMEGYGTDIRMDVNDNFGDTVYVTYDGTTTALEDSYITVYGEVYGRYTYESQAGWKITLPLIQAKYVEVGN